MAIHPTPTPSPVFTASLVRNTPHYLRRRPLADAQVLFWPAWQLLMLIRVTQRTAFTEPLDPKRRYLICCSPHGAFAFSGITWVGPQIRLQLLPE